MANIMANMGAGYALSSYTVPSNTNILVELPKYIYNARLMPSAGNRPTAYAIQNYL